MVRDDFGVLIVSHGRASNVKTVHTLVNKCNYTGKWYIVLDNEDSSIQEYINNYGQEHIIVFDKLAKAKECDTCDIPSRPRNVVLFARNACVDIARKLGLRFFLELDDDYTEFRSRQWDGDKLSSIYVKDFDSICNEVLEFLQVSKADCVAFSQTGDFIGGRESKVYRERLTRKAMNAFFCTLDRPFDFVGRMNDDVNTYCLLGSQGKLFFTIADIALNQPDTQTSGGRFNRCLYR